MTSGLYHRSASAGQVFLDDATFDEIAEEAGRSPCCFSGNDLSRQIQRDLEQNNRRFEDYRANGDGDYAWALPNWPDSEDAMEAGTVHAQDVHKGVRAVGSSWFRDQAAAQINLLHATINGRMLLEKLSRLCKDNGAMITLAEARLPQSRATFSVDNDKGCARNVCLLSGDVLTPGEPATDILIFLQPGAGCSYLYQDQLTRPSLFMTMDQVMTGKYEVVPTPPCVEMFTALQTADDLLQGRAILPFFEDHFKAEPPPHRARMIGLEQATLQDEVFWQAASRPLIGSENALRQELDLPLRPGYRDSDKWLPQLGFIRDDGLSRPRVKDYVKGDFPTHDDITGKLILTGTAVNRAHPPLRSQQGAFDRPQQRLTLTA